MPVFHDKQVVFIHVPKNAGSSISTALGLTKEDLSFRNEDRLCGWDPGWNGCMHHLPARDVLKYLGTYFYGRYFKFAFIRNPFDRIVSDLAWLKEQQPKENITMWRYLTMDYPVVDVTHRWLQSSFLYSTHGQLLLDFVGRYEHLERDWARICERLKMDLPLPHQNQCRPKGEPYQTYFTDVERELAEKMYGEDLARFGYKF